MSLFVYTTGHGERMRTLVGNQSFLPTCSRYLSEEEMAEYMQDIAPRVGILVSDQCYGGGFAERIGKRRGWIGISASSAEQISRENSFPQAFFHAWEDVSSDSNDDGKISIREAFDYAVQHDIYAKSNLQKPEIIFSEINPEDIFFK